MTDRELERKLADMMTHAAPDDLEIGRAHV